MAAVQEPQLDETVWTNSPEVQRLGGLNQNTVHFYFSQSPFFDRSSKNGALITQAQFNPSMAYLLFNRDAFERRLQEMPGIEYLIANDTPELRSLSSNEANDIWIIRKQDRKTGSFNAELEILGTYFIVNDNVFMASSLGDIINNRLLTSVLALTKTLSAASPLPYFTPRTGHTYYPPVPRSTAHPTIKDGAAPPSASASREASPLPDSTSQPPPHSRTASPDPTSSRHRKPTAAADPRSLIASFNLSQAYADDYLDENPLRGEPGAFVFSATSAHVQAARARRLREEEEGGAGAGTGGGLRIQDAAAGATAATGGGGGGRVTSPASTATPPSPGGTGQGATTGGRAGKGGGKAKRRKSKPSVSPTSPVAGQGMA
ncbi:MAG: Mediator of RNA polymerase II transcription subunit 6 [Bathelium mastoideum]|nr:MAG: Mediator of RNA polymerase II transcription subunit 6 [Bathelium mastoideum]KAI9685520.1 MAG: Mediator of RNA polymerase II transcription subunit 6 [Bathelium mastoideum]